MQFGQDNSIFWGCCLSWGHRTDVLGMSEKIVGGITIKYFYTVEPKQAGEKSRRSTHSGWTITPVCWRNGRPMNWKFDKGSLFLSTTPSISLCTLSPSQACFLVWAFNSALSLFEIQVNNNHVINTHTHHTLAQSLLKARPVLPQNQGDGAKRSWDRKTWTTGHDRAGLHSCGEPFSSSMATVPVALCASFLNGMLPQRQIQHDIWRIWGKTLMFCFWGR